MICGIFILKVLLNISLSKIEYVKVVTIFVLCSIYESVTSQIDNLYLPLFFTILVMIIWFFVLNYFISCDFILIYTTINSLITKYITKTKKNQ